MQKILIERYQGGAQNSPPLKFEYKDSLHTGIYKIASFNKGYLERKGQDFIAFTDTVFSRLQYEGAESIILDLRNNRGGWTAYSKQLFSYFIDKPYEYLSSIKVIKTKNYSFQPLIIREPGYDDTMKFVKTKNDLLLWSNNPNLEVQPSAANHFKGKVFVLINGNTMSASGVLASSLSLRRKVMFLGEESGGAVGGLNSMPLSIRLPNSHIVATLSTAMYSFPHSSKNPKRGVFPDEPVKITLQDLLNETDTTLERAFKVITLENDRKK